MRVRRERQDRDRSDDDGDSQSGLPASPASTAGSGTAGGLRYDGGMSDQPTAWQFQFRSEMTHQVRFKGTGLGVTFEDNGETGYLYATNEQHDEIFDALHLYNRGEGDELAPGEDAYIVCSHTLRKAGIFYRDEFQAIFDFANRRAGCRSGFPPPETGWCIGSHDWDDELAEGLE